MLAMREQFSQRLEGLNIEFDCPEVTQTLSETELIEMIPKYDGWIVGDDPVTKDVLLAASGKLKAVVKWGIGTDNIDFAAFKELDIPIDNTPGMFGDEVADIAMGYIISLARETYEIDREVRKGNWPKNRGISLKEKTVGLVGLGDIGSNLAKKLFTFGMRIIAYDPYATIKQNDLMQAASWPTRLSECDFLVLTCLLNEETQYLLNLETLNSCKDGVRIVNVSRGGLIKENDLIESLKTKKVHSAALDVFENEPLPINSELRKFSKCILGSHNSSNTNEAVVRTNKIAITKLLRMLKIKE